MPDATATPVLEGPAMAGSVASTPDVAAASSVASVLTPVVPGSSEIGHAPEGPLINIAPAPDSKEQANATLAGELGVELQADPPIPAQGILSDLANGMGDSPEPPGPTDADAAPDPVTGVPRPADNSAVAHPSTPDAPSATQSQDVAPRPAVPDGPIPPHPAPPKPPHTPDAAAPSAATAPEAILIDPLRVRLEEGINIGGIIFRGEPETAFVEGIQSLIGSKSADPLLSYYFDYAIATAEALGVSKDTLRIGLDDIYPGVDALGERKDGIDKTILFKLHLSQERPTTARLLTADEIEVAKAEKRKVLTKLLQENSKLGPQAHTVESLVSPEDTRDTAKASIEEAASNSRSGKMERKVLQKIMASNDQSNLELIAMGVDALAKGEGNINLSLAGLTGKEKREAKKLIKSDRKLRKTREKVLRDIEKRAHRSQEVRKQLKGLRGAARKEKLRQIILQEQAATLMADSARLKQIEKQYNIKNLPPWYLIFLKLFFGIAAITALDLVKGQLSEAMQA